MKKGLYLLLCFRLAIFATVSGQNLQWIGDAPVYNRGVSWGVPFEKGKVNRNQHFYLSSEENKQIAVQQYPLAFWPDGSVKWMGFAATGIYNQQGLKLKTGNEITVENPVRVEKTSSGIQVSNGITEFSVPVSGENLFEYIRLKNTQIVSGGKLIARVRDASGNFSGNNSVEFTGKITEVKAEQSGPLKAVICIKGNYYSHTSQRSLFPFTMRIYCYQGSEQIGIVHSWVFDGNQEKDFIQGTGIQFEIPFRESLHNRHVAFSGENSGIWHEAVKPLITRHQLNNDAKSNIAVSQMEGKRLSEFTPQDTPMYKWYPHLPAWDSYKLTQLHPDGFSISKQTQSKSAWLHASDGSRSSGLAFTGDVSGGLAISLKDFWQSYPSSLEVSGARSEKALLTAWFWSPDGQEMDLRHYDTIAHNLDVTYEDVQPGLSTPYGIAKTAELTLYLTDSVPSGKILQQYADAGTKGYHLTCTPAYLHSVRAFGCWSLPDRTTAFGNWLENQLDSAFLFYQRAVEENHWYGYWNYGDVMHSYDPSRHVWRYDIGGFAWANTELAPNDWLWYSFLRSGRADIFKMAEAMTRHTGEVDAYHSGDMKGLGSRHNVSHWGCGSKEARIGQAAWKRFYYYLTTDERCGDLMKESLDAEQSMSRFEPLRIAQPREKFPYGGPTRLRWGPDWLALAGNWMTEWERTGNNFYRDKIITGLDCLAKLPDNLFTGTGGLSYDPASGKIWYDGKPGQTNQNHLATIMGGYEILMELFDMINHPAFRKTFTEYGRLYSMPDDDPYRNAENENLGGVKFRNPRLAAFAAREMNDENLANRAWKEFLGENSYKDGKLRSLYDSEIINPPLVLNSKHENPRIGTNGTSQWGLNAIILPELIGVYLPDSQFQFEKRYFEKLNAEKTDLIFQDGFKNDLQKNWFTDGKKASYQKSKSGLIFKAGPTPANDADHAVLWTKKSFSGNIKVEFDFTRLDEVTKFVNIIYLMAEGSGKGEYSTDISTWKKLREIPSMNQYFNHMNAFHLSFAAFENDNEDGGADYIRARRYKPETGKGLQGTELMPEYFRTGFFQPGLKHHIVIIRYQDEIFMEVSNAQNKKLYHWKSAEINSLKSGRIGLRLMGSRSSSFENFRVYQISRF